MIKKITCVALIGTLLSLAIASAQNPNAYQQAQQYNQTQDNTQLRLNPNSVYNNGSTAPELYPGESTDVGPQFIVKSKPIRKWFEASADTQYFYTSNAFLDDQHKKDTGLLVSTAQLSLSPTPFQVWGDDLVAPRLGFRQQWYNYGLDTTANQLNNIDFDVQTVFTDVRYRFLKSWVATVGFEWNRLLSHEPPTADYSEFYKDYSPTWGLEHQFTISDTMSFSIGYQGYYHFSSVDEVPGISPGNVNDRLDESLRFMFTQEVIPYLYFQPFYRFQYTYYTHFGSNRDDYLHTIGATLTYMVNEWFSARTFVTYDIKGSDNSLVPTYHNLNAGIGISGSISF
jgi:hypothetical protein